MTVGVWPCSYSTALALVGLALLLLDTHSSQIPALVAVQSNTLLQFWHASVKDGSKKRKVRGAGWSSSPIVGLSCGYATPAKIVVACDQVVVVFDSVLLFSSAFACACAPNPRLTQLARLVVSHCGWVALLLPRPLFIHSNDAHCILIASVLNSFGCAVLWESVDTPVFLTRWSHYCPSASHIHFILWEPIDCLLFKCIS